MVTSITNDPLVIPEKTTSGEDTGPQLEDVLRRLLEKNPAARLDMDELAIHPWVSRSVSGAPLTPLMTTQSARSTTFSPPPTAHFSAYPSVPEFSLGTPTIGVPGAPREAVTRRSRSKSIVSVTPADLQHAFLKGRNVDLRSKMTLLSKVRRRLSKTGDRTSSSSRGAAASDAGRQEDGFFPQTPIAGGFTLTITLKEPETAAALHGALLALAAAVVCQAAADNFEAPRGAALRVFAEAGTQTEGSVGRSGKDRLLEKTGSLQSLVGASAHGMLSSFSRRASAESAGGFDATMVSSVAGDTVADIAAQVALLTRTLNRCDSLDATDNNSSTFKDLHPEPSHHRLPRGQSLTSQHASTQPLPNATSGGTNVSASNKTTPSPTPLSTPNDTCIDTTPLQTRMLSCLSPSSIPLYPKSPMTAFAANGSPAPVRKIRLEALSEEGQTEFLTGNNSFGAAPSSPQGVAYYNLASGTPREKRVRRKTLIDAGPSPTGSKKFLFNASHFDAAQAHIATKREASVEQLLGSASSSPNERASDRIPRAQSAVISPFKQRGGLLLHPHKTPVSSATSPRSPTHSQEDAASFGSPQHASPSSPSSYRRRSYTAVLSPTASPALTPASPVVTSPLR
eukprot:gene11802-18211_t